ncbi:hypothetical protein G3N94_34610 [Burkholderia sp. Ac-20353]|nr:hypothetical protein [Burkholderia sp. Ac-20353]
MTNPFPMIESSPLPQLICADAVLSRMPPTQMVDALEAAHRCAYAPLARLHASVPRDAREDGEMLVWLGGARDGATGTKVVSISPDNSRRANGAADTWHAAVLLCDPEDGRFRSIIVGNAFTRYKTAADSVLGARLLARHAPQTLTIIGAGAQAATHLRVMAAEFPTLRRVDVWNRNHERAVRLAGQAAGDAPGADVRAVEHLERSVRDADLVVCVTSSTSPVLDGAWLRDGCHVDLVGGYTPSMREANDAALLRSRIYVDHRALVTENCGDIRQPLDAGVIDATDIEGDLFDLCGGCVTGRRHDADITLFKNGGGGHLDLMFADWLSRRCAAPDDGRTPSDH